MRLVISTSLIYIQTEGAVGGEGGLYTYAHKYESVGGCTYMYMSSHASWYTLKQINNPEPCNQFNTPHEVLNLTTVKRETVEYNRTHSNKDH